MTSYLLLCLSMLMPQQARDARREAVPAGTATISGVVVTDESSPQAVKRARVELTADGRPPLSVFTSDLGRFVIDHVPAGRYMLVATKPGYVRAAYGAKRPNRPGTAMTIADGQQVSDVVLNMARGAVITGTIRDDLGQPAQGVRVTVLQYRMQGGERVLVPVASSAGALGDSTDDLGAYRLFGLAAGEYVVTANPRPLGGSDVRQMTPAEIQSVQQALQQLAVSGGLNASAPTPQPKPVTVTYASVFYPGTTTAATAATVTVAAGEERSGIDMSLQLVRTARVEGMVVTPNGVPPQTAQLLMVPRNAAGSGMPTMISLNRVPVGPDGKFVYTGVAPGQYTISARIGGSNFVTLPNLSDGIGYSTGYSVATGGAARVEPSAAADGRGRNASAPSALWAMADVIVDGEDVTGLTLNMQPGLSLNGRIVVEAIGTDAPSDLSRARVSLAPAGSGTLMVGAGGLGGQPDGSGRFALADVTPGRYRVTAQLNAPGAWTLKSAVVNGKESLDFPVEIGPDNRVSEAIVTFTNQTQEVSGTLSDASGRPAPDYTIVVFPADRTYWSSARRISTARPDTEGKFAIATLPAGDYRIAALTDIAPGEQSDPAFLEQLVPASVAFSLRGGEKRVQDIRIAGQKIAGEK